LDAARAAGAPSAASVRRAFADEVLSGVHVALRAAHAARLVHCDVRPSNVAIADGAPLLLDWGLVRAQGAYVCGCGDALFALDSVFLQASYAACAWQDLASAALLWETTRRDDARDDAPFGAHCSADAAAWRRAAVRTQRLGGGRGGACVCKSARRWRACARRKACRSASSPC
jgi:serine/threonine protein kinase